MLYEVHVCQCSCPGMQQKIGQWCGWGQEGAEEPLPWVWRICGDVWRLHRIDQLLDVPSHTSVCVILYSLREKEVPRGGW